MTKKPEIEKLRVLHDLHTQFDVPDAIRSTLQSQLSATSQEQVERFISGFKIENWFEWIFCSMPWVQLTHGLDQQQFPGRSKQHYQVPDFLVLVETSARTHRPLLVEVKRVSRDKRTLKIQDSQVTLCERYASSLNMPLVYAVYWEFLSAWTLNTVDSLECKSTRNLPILRAFELDCSAILGDISYLIPPSLVRRSRFSKHEVTPSCVQHEIHGRLICDTVTLGEKYVEMTSLESAAIDSMLVMKPRSVKDLGDGETELVETIDDVYMLKLSSWITRHLRIFDAAPSEEYAAVSATVITDLMKKLDCRVIHMFPTDRTEGVKRIDTLFRTSAPSST